MKTWKLILIVELLFVVALFLLSPWLTSNMSHDPKASDDRHTEVKARLQKKQAEEKKRHQNQRLAQKDLEELKRDKDEKAKRALKKKIKKMLSLHERMKNERRKHEHVIKNRDKKDLSQRRYKILERPLEEMKNQAEVLKRDALKNEDQQKISDRIEEMSQLHKKIKDGDSDAMAELQDKADELKQQLDALRQKQEELNGTAQSKEVGLPGHTAWMQELLKSMETSLSEMTSQPESEFNDISALPQSQNMPSSELEQMGLQDLYQEAQSIEQAIQKDFQAAKSIQMAMKEGLSVKDAASSFPKTQQDRPQQNFQAMGQQLRTVADMNSYGKKLQAASAQVSNMLKTANTMMQQMGGRNHVSSLNQALGQARRQQQIQHAVRAGTSSGMNALSLSAMMRQASSSKRKASGGQGGSQGKAGGGKGGGQGGGEGQGGGDRNKGKGGHHMASKVEAEQKLIRVESKSVQAEAMPGRRFTSKSKRSGWLYLDTWYVIGPWENHGRIDYKTIHPPEVEIDLSKAYVEGKKDRLGNHKRLKWEFTQSSEMKIIPPDEQGDSTYYAWTEVFFEEEQDMLIAIASDDAAKVWINDMLVWEDNGQSAWNLDEGFREVYFKKGFNKVLVRIENGPILCTFSVLMCPSSEGS